MEITDKTVPVHTKTTEVTQGLIITTIIGEGLNRGNLILIREELTHLLTGLTLRHIGHILRHTDHLLHRIGLILHPLDLIHLRIDHILHLQDPTLHREVIALRVQDHLQAAVEAVQIPEEGDVKSS